MSPTPRSAAAPALTLAAVLAPLLSTFAPLGMAPLFVVVALAGLHDCWRHRLWRSLDRPLLALLLAAALFGAASTLWAIDKTQTLRTSLVLGGEFLGGMALLAAAARLEPAQRHRVVLPLAGSVSVVVAVLLFEQLTPGMKTLLLDAPPTTDGGYARLSGLSRGLTFLSILLFPLTLMLWRRDRRVWALALFAGGAAAIAVSHSLASKLALPLAVVVALGFLWRPRAMAVPAAAGGALAILSALVLALQIPDPQTAYDRAPWLSGSGHHRLTIWRFSADNAVEKPLFGWALDASRVIPGADDPVFYRRMVDGTPVPVPEARLPLHPHSAPIQLWLELGLVGALLGAAVLALAFLRQATRAPAAAACGGAALAAGLMVACVSYGIWQSWWQGSIWLCAAFVALAGRAAADRGGTADQP